MLKAEINFQTILDSELSDEYIDFTMCGCFLCLYARSIIVEKCFEFQL